MLPQRHVCAARAAGCGRNASVPAVLRMVALSAVSAFGAPATASPLAPSADEFEREWVVAGGDWQVADKAIEQTTTDDAGFAFRPRLTYADVRFSAEFMPLADGDGVRAAILACRSTGSRTYYFAHFDSRNSQVILVRSGRANGWNELARRGGVPLPGDEWSRGEIRCEGRRLSVLLNDRLLLEATDDTLSAGCIGLGTSQGHVRFRNLQIDGDTAEAREEWHVEKPPYVIVCEDAGAGAYEAFPDVVRLRNGDLLCVLYAGYGHVSLPDDEHPNGGRVSAVRSTDNGETWSEARIVYDDEMDNRDPHIAQLSDGTLICTFFSLYPQGERWGFGGTQMVRSMDGGQTWDSEPTLVSASYACSAPVREQPDGSLVLGLYHEDQGGAWGAVTISRDKGATWSEPIDIGRESGHRHDAETDTVRLANGELFAVMRPCMCYAVSPDGGRTWSPSAEIGFEGHAPYLFRHSSGMILLAHRLPGTALHYSTDEAKTWQGPVTIDTVGGAYPSLCELPDRRVFCVYYEEGAGSNVRGRWLTVGRETVAVSEGR